MKRTLLVFVFTVAFFAPLSAAHAQASAACVDPESVVQAQVDAYNKHDLDGFVATYAANVQVRSLKPDTLLVTGIGDFRKAYEWLPKSPAGFGVNIAKRVVSGCFVIDDEWYKAVEGSPTKQAGAAIYQVEGRRIVRVWFATP